ncbi:MAG TPA: family 20 glycosylhydrolase, partial [Verrucomicrobiae bacterium]|nr:family 20 glycosylhydrolase [Verrucomicrobiae bacterium]
MKIKSRIAAVILCLMAMASAADVVRPAIIPLPQKMELRSGIFKLTPDTSIAADSVSARTARFLAARVREVTGYPLNLISAKSGGGGNILLTTKDADTNLGLEGYALTVTPDSVVIRAPTQAGLFYGVQTLLQLLPPDIFSTKRITHEDWQVPCVQIEDWPRFNWRGLMLDASRHFFTVQEVERLLDAMATLKMNVFHWHLTDDQGWRIEIKKYPKLTQIGGWRPGVGFGLDPKSTTAYGPDGRYGGFYTQADIREVVAYAAARHITVVPEIEMPGHSLAALAAYPQLG